MYVNDIDSTSKNHENISEKIESISFNSIRKVLPDNAIRYACDKVGYKYRRRIITPTVTILHMVLNAIRDSHLFFSAEISGICVGV